MNSNRVKKDRFEWIGLVIKILDFVIALFKSSKKSAANGQQEENN